MGLLILVSSPEIAPYDLRRLKRFFSTLQYRKLAAGRSQAMVLGLLASQSSRVHRLETQIGVSDSENPEKMGAGSGVLQIYQYLGDSCEFESRFFFKKKKLVNTPKLNFFFHPKETIAKENSVNQCLSNLR